MFSTVYILGYNRLNPSGGTKDIRVCNTTRGMKPRMKLEGKLMLGAEVTLSEKVATRSGTHFSGCSESFQK